MPDDIERMLDSINFPADIGLLWDYTPAFGDAPFNKSPRPNNMPRSLASSREPAVGETHYLSTIVMFAKIRSSASDNIYSWAALHLAHVKSSSTLHAEARYRRAVRLLYNDVRAAEHIDLTLVTVWILLQYELFSAKGVDGFISLLNYIADVVEDIFERNSIDVVKEQLGTVGPRAFMWLRRLLRCLKTYSSIYDVIDGRSKGSARPLRHRQIENHSEQESAWTAIRSSLQEIQEEVENSNFAAPKLAMRVEYPRLKEDPEDERSWPNVEECAARIIGLSRQVTLSHPNSPQAIWPQTLFLAGICTDDPIYHSWVLAAFAQAEPWGPNMRKTKHLLERISGYPRVVKSRLDIMALMVDIGDIFVV
ncbi:hypothetical protein GGR53DRAFT_520937 [Hypoxylon sp. FL1150]|nr:hypothetical protein GGR53DRAFT_520937 [Hypoxylon sp. FL1150]